MQPSYIQNTTASACTMNVDAPHKYAVFKTGTTDGNLIPQLTREQLRVVYTADATLSAQPIKYNVTTATGAKWAAAIGDVNYLEAGVDVTAQTAIVAGTLTTAVSGRTSGASAQAHVDNGGDALEIDYVVADVEGTMTLTEVKVVNRMRDYAVNDTIVFAVGGQDGGVLDPVAATITIVAGNLTASKELQSLYVSDVSGQTNRLQAGTPIYLTNNDTDPAINFVLSAKPSVLDLTENIVIQPTDRTPFLVSRFKCANSTTTFTFNTLT